MKEKIITITTAMLLCISSFSQTVKLDSGLVAAYPFSGNANDISSHNLNGAVTGAQLTNDRYDKANSAYLFDGTANVIQVNNISSYLSKNEVSISIWARPDLLKQQVVFMISPDDPSDRLLGAINFSQGGAPYAIWDFGDINNNGRIGVAQNDLSNWEHYVFWSSQSQNMAKIYRNGQVLASGTHSSKLVNLNKAFLIGGGSDYNGSKFYFQGAIDDIRIYNRTLNDSEVVALYHNKTFTGIVDMPNDNNEMQVYPNPSTNGVFNIQLSNPSAIMEMSIYDYTGKMVYQKQNVNNIIDLTGEAKGLYLLKTTNSKNQVSTSKLILK